MKNRVIEWVKCPQCGYSFQGYKSKNGDGSILFVRTHKRMDYSGYHFRRIKCEGSNKEGEVINETNKL